MTTYFYIYKLIQFNQSERGEKEIRKIFICLRIRNDIIHHLKDERTTQVEAEVKTEIIIQETEYSGETLKVWPFSELCGI